MSLSSKIFLLKLIILRHYFYYIFLDKFAVLHHARDLCGTCAWYFWNITSVASFGRLWAPSVYEWPLRSSGCQHKKSFKKGMRCASSPKHRNSVCFGVDKEECERIIIEWVIITVFIMSI